MGSFVAPNGEVVVIDDPALAQRALDTGYKPITPQAAAPALTQQTTDTSAAAAGISSVLSGATLGASDALFSAIGNRGTTDALRQAREAHPDLSLGANVVGAIAPAVLTGGDSLLATPTRLVSEGGASLGQLAADAGLGRVGSAVVGGAAEGAIYGAGQAVSDLALSDDPLTLEHVASTLSSGMLYGTAVGGATGGAGKIAELGLLKAKGALDGVLARSNVAKAAPDLASMDLKGLKAAEGAELESIDAARAPQREQLVTDLADFRTAGKRDQIYRAVEGAPDRETREVAKAYAQADFQLDRLLNNKVDLAANPARALRPLQQQQQALERLMAARDAERMAFEQAPERIRAEIAAGKVKGELGPFSPSGLDAAVEREMARQYGGKAATAASLTREQIEDMLAKANAAGDRDIARSARLALRDAAAPADQEALAATKERIRGDIMAGRVPGETAKFSPAGLDLAVERELARQQAKGSFGAATRERAREHIARIINDATPYAPPKRLVALDKVPAALERNRQLQAKLGELTAAPASERLAQIAEAKDALSTPAHRSLGAQLLEAVPLGPLGPAAGIARTAIGSLKKAAGAVAKRAGAAASTFLDVSAKATKHAPVLATKVLARLSYGDGTARPAPTGETLHALYKARSDEVKAQVSMMPDGSIQMRPAARQRMASKLDALRVTDPRAADQLETAGARRIEYLASIMPRLPDFGTVQIGPDHRQVPDLAMRSWARSANALENPAATLERMATGQFVPEEARALRAVYPELVASIMQQIVQRLPELRRSLPYQRRLALSMLTGVAVDPAMTPRVLSVLQGMYATEPGTAGGTQAPIAQPQFGSVKADKGTPAQQRQGDIV